MESERRAYFSSPVGVLEVVGTSEAVTAVRFKPGRKPETSEWTTPLEACLRELGEYFAGKRKFFTVPIRPQGTDFQRRVWGALAEIPFGTTSTYADIARAVGRPDAVRAVGSANGRNPIPVLIPCHRVIGGDGRLVGYGGGLWRKAWLLAHERAFTGTGGTLFRE
ncbi:MAG: methylated-DNA--[protein]-cysteine S-methyltransferase [Candidatus Aminicenantes bacterium]|nr:methylated-DNA--[protein]-cysteine S-methyltransferase [Candidatus Aminicenantes bacterium]